MTEWILVICVALQDTGNCGHIRQVPYASVQQCNDQRDAVAIQRAVAYAYCRPARHPELVK